MDAKVAVDVGKAYNPWNKDFSMRMARLMHDTMVKRTQSGLGSDGQPMGTYSRRAKYIRKKMGLQTAFIDMTMTGAMLGTMVVKATNYRATVYPKVKYGWWINEKHPWIGFTDTTVAPLDELLLVLIDEAINGANGQQTIPGTGA